MDTQCREIRRTVLRTRRSDLDDEGPDKDEHWEEGDVLNLEDAAQHRARDELEELGTKVVTCE